MSKKYLNCEWTTLREQSGKTVFWCCDIREFRIKLSGDSKIILLQLWLEKIQRLVSMTSRLKCFYFLLSWERESCLLVAKRKNITSRVKWLLTITLSSSCLGRVMLVATEYLLGFFSSPDERSLVMGEFLAQVRSVHTLNEGHIKDKSISYSILKFRLCFFTTSYHWITHS